MTLVWIIVLGLLIGAVLGGLGGGGAVLTVPALVYVVGQPAQNATTSSLVIVGVTAAVGVLSYVSARQVRWRLALAFGLIGLPATWVGSLLNERVDEDVLLLGFAGLLLVAAVAMVGDQARTTPSSTDRSGSTGGAVSGDHGPSGRPVWVLERQAARSSSETPRRTSPLTVAFAGVAVGVLTGFFGVGGGFVIVPALVLALGVPMHQAVGTSLLIVALNSGTSLLARTGSAHFDWDIIVPFTVAAMVATLLGKRVADRLPDRGLKVGFATLLVLVAGYTAWHSVDGLVSDSATSAAGRSPGQGPNLREG